MDGWITWSTRCSACLASLVWRDAKIVEETLFAADEGEVEWDMEIKLITGEVAEGNV